eukprot:Rmarinus@m.7047
MLDRILSSATILINTIAEGHDSGFSNTDVVSALPSLEQLDLVLPLPSYCTGTALLSSTQVSTLVRILTVLLKTVGGMIGQPMTSCQIQVVSIPITWILALAERLLRLRTAVTSAAVNVRTRASDLLSWIPRIHELAFELIASLALTTGFYLTPHISQISRLLISYIAGTLASGSSSATLTRSVVLRALAYRCVISVVDAVGPGCSPLLASALLPRVTSDLRTCAGGCVSEGYEGRSLDLLVIASCELLCTFLSSGCVSMLGRTVVSEVEVGSILPCVRAMCASSSMSASLSAAGPKKDATAALVRTPALVALHLLRGYELCLKTPGSTSHDAAYALFLRFEHPDRAVAEVGKRILDTSRLILSRPAVPLPSEIAAWAHAYAASTSSEGAEGDHRGANGTTVAASSAAAAASVAAGAAGVDQEVFATFPEGSPAKKQKTDSAPPPTSALPQDSGAAPSASRPASTHTPVTTTIPATNVSAGIAEGSAGPRALGNTFPHESNPGTSRNQIAREVSSPPRKNKQITPTEEDATGNTAASQGHTIEDPTDSSHAVSACPSHPVGHVGGLNGSMRSPGIPETTERSSAPRAARYPTDELSHRSGATSQVPEGADRKQSRTGSHSPRSTKPSEPVADLDFVDADPDDDDDDEAMD